MIISVTFGRILLWLITPEQQPVNTLSLEYVYALPALKFTLVLGILGVINLSYSAVSILSAYIALQATLHFELPLWTALAVGPIVNGVVGLIIGVLLLCPPRHCNVPHLTPMTATIDADIAVNSAMQGVFGVENLHFSAGPVPDVSLGLGGTHLTSPELNIIMLSFVLMAALVLLLRRMQLGHASRAAAESSKAAVLPGINVEGLPLPTSFVTATLGRLSGVLISLYSNAVFLSTSQPMLYKGIAVIILGSLGDIRGVIPGGLFLGFAKVLSVAYIGSTTRDVIAFGLPFLIPLVRPQGLFGKVSERKA